MKLLCVFVCVGGGGGGGAAYTNLKEFLNILLPLSSDVYISDKRKINKQIKNPQKIK